MKRKEFSLLSAAMVLLAALACVTSTPAAADDDAWRSVAGEWRGHYQNSTGGEGASTLTLREDAEGHLRGSWDGVSVRGRRISGDSIELRGRTEKRSYQITGTREGRAMVLKYLTTRLDSKGSYDGSARLHRHH